MLKRVSSDVTPHLDGIVDGLVAEALNDEEVNIYQLDRGDEFKTILFMTWKAGEFEKATGERGMFMSKTNKIMIPLLR